MVGMRVFLASLFIYSFSLHASSERPLFDCAWVLSQYPSMPFKPTGADQFTRYFGRQKRARIIAAIESGTPLLFYRMLPSEWEYIELATPLSIDDNLDPIVEMVRKAPSGDQRVRFRFADLRILAGSPSELPAGLEKLRGAQPALPPGRDYSDWAAQAHAASENGQWVQLSELSGYPRRDRWVAKVAGYDVFGLNIYVYLTDIGGIPGTFEILDWPYSRETPPQYSDRLSPVQRDFQTAVPLGSGTRLIPLNDPGGSIESSAGYEELLTTLGESRGRILTKAVRNRTATIFYGSNEEQVCEYHVVAIELSPDLESHLIELHAADRSHRTFTTSKGLICGMVASVPAKPSVAALFGSFRPRSPDWKAPSRHNTFRTYLRGIVEGRHFAWSDPLNGGTYDGRPELLVQDAAGRWILEVGGRVKTLDSWESEGASPELEVDEETGTATEVYQLHQTWRMLGGELPFPTIPSPATSPFATLEFDHPSLRLDPWEAAKEPAWKQERLIALQWSLVNRSPITICIEAHSQASVQLDARVVFLNKALAALEPVDGSRTVIRPLVAIKVCPPH
jgi:hypothetical protein